MIQCWKVVVNSRHPPLISDLDGNAFHISLLSRISLYHLRKLSLFITVDRNQMGTTLYWRLLGHTLIGLHGWLFKNLYCTWPQVVNYVGSLFQCWITTVLGEWMAMLDLHLYLWHWTIFLFWCWSRSLRSGLCGLYTL